MDIYILVFLVSVSFILFLISRIVDGWKRLGLGWVAGGLMMIIGFNIWDGGSITSTAVFTDKTWIEIPLQLGISSENFLIISVCIGLVMIISSSGEWF